MDSLVVASANPDKVAEMVDLLGHSFEIEARPPEMPDTIEDGDTLEFNAIKKAQEVSDYTNKPALADDTGLFVDALNGAPGVYSARYAGIDVTYEQNVDKLLAEMEHYTKLGQRLAHFETVVALVAPGFPPLTFSGRVEGYISSDRLGARGFGYDPVFVPTEGDGRSFAQMSADEKNAISHRARAIAAFTASLP